MTIVEHAFDAVGAGPMPADEAESLAGEVRTYLLEQAEEQVGNSEFLRQLKAGTLPPEKIQRFWLDWHSQVWEVNSLIGVAYHLFAPFFRRNLDLLPTFADKVADELIHPEPPGHLLIVWKQGEIFGLTRDQMINHPISPECRALMEWHRGLLYEGTMIEYWSAMLYEEYTGYWAQAFGKALVEQYGYARASTVYFTTHEEADLVEHDGIMAHGEFNWMVFRRMLEQGEARFRPGVSISYCIDTELALRRRFLDARAAG